MGAKIFEYLFKWHVSVTQSYVESEKIKPYSFN